MDPEYKKLAEARVTGHKGTTLLEVVVITFTAVFINSISVKFFREKTANTTTSLSSSSIASKIILLLEQWLLLVPPLLILYSSPSETGTYHYAAFFLVLASLYMFLSSKTSSSASKSNTSSGNNNKNIVGDSASATTTTTISYDPATAMLRSTLMFHTMTAILQVDFPIFPFRFMKCENFGISLMDVGVGAFVFSGAVTRVAGEEMKRMKAALAGNQQQNKTATSSSSSSWMSSLRSLIKLLGSSVPLFILGGFRLATVAYTGYQQHLTEYGKHWNFFLTLGFMPLVVALVHKIGSVVRNLGVKLFNNNKNTNKNSKTKNDTEQQEQHQHQSEYILDTVVGLTLLLLHQIALSFPFFGSTDNNLTAYVMSPHRRSLIESNKEGIVSSIGYGALYLIARGVFGLFFLSINNISTNINNTKKSSSSTGSILLAFIIGVLTVGVTMALDRYVQETSRRLCNAPYVLFCVGGGFITYSICAFVTSSMKSNNNTGNKNSRLCLLTAIGDNQLPLFLIANLCTGAVNHLMRTIFASTLVSYAVMVTYLTFVLGVAVFLSTNNIKLKFW